MARPPSPLASLRRLFARSSRPMYALDEQRRLVFANEAMAQWTGESVDQLLGLPCLAVPAQERRAALAAGLAPAADVLMGHQCRTVVQAPVGETDDGELLWQQRGATVLSWSDEGELAATFFMLDTEEFTGAEPEESRGSRLRRLAVRLRARLATHATFHLLGESSLMQRVRQQVETAGQTSASALIVGPPGTGAEEVAHAVYYGGVSGHGILPLACPLLDAELLTNALEDLERSQYELVEGPDAILLLDVDQMPPEAQASVYQRLQSLSPAPKLLATASRPLTGDRAPDAFHRDFAAFISELVIELPALADRPEDIPQLAQCVLHEENAGRDQPVDRFDDDAIELLTVYPWFDNHRELARLVAEACEASLSNSSASSESRSVIHAADLPHPLHAAQQQAAHPVRELAPVDLPKMLEDLEREAIQRALALAKGNKSQAARLLGLRRARLLRRIDALDIEEE